MLLRRTDLSRKRSGDFHAVRADLAVDAGEKYRPDRPKRRPAKSTFFNCLAGENHADHRKDRVSLARTFNAPRAGGRAKAGIGPHLPGAGHV